MRYEELVQLAQRYLAALARAVDPRILQIRQLRERLESASEAELRDLVEDLERLWRTGVLAAQAAGTEIGLAYGHDMAVAVGATPTLPDQQELEQSQATYWALAAGFARLLRSLRDRPDTAVLREVLARAAAAVGTEAMRSYRTAYIQHWRDRDRIIGYVRRSSRDARTCAACLALDGKIYRDATVYESHPHCRCVLIPYVRGLQIDSGTAWLQKQPQDVARSILGDRRYDIWVHQYRKGRLEQFVAVRHTQYGATLQIV